MLHLRIINNRNTTLNYGYWSRRCLGTLAGYFNFRALKPCSPAHWPQVIFIGWYHKIETHFQGLLDVAAHEICSREDPWYQFQFHGSPCNIEMFAFTRFQVIIQKRLTIKIVSNRLLTATNTYEIIIAPSY